MSKIIRGLSVEQQSPIQEAAVYRLAPSEVEGEFEIVSGRTPIDEVLEREKEQLFGEQLDAEARAERQEAIAAFMGFLFKPKANKQLPNVFEITARLYCWAYLLRPELVTCWSLNEIGKCFDVTRQCFSKRVQQEQRHLGICRSRNQKSETAVSIYQENTAAWHAERIAKEKAEARRQYLKEYRAKHRDRLNEKHREYYARNKERRLKQMQENRRKRKV